MESNVDGEHRIFMINSTSTGRRSMITKRKVALEATWENRSFVIS